MGAVFHFRRREELRLCPGEWQLLQGLRGSLQVMWRGGWAEPGEYGGVALLRNQRCLGVWTREPAGYVYRPIESGEASVHAVTVDGAHQQTLLLLGDLPSPD